MSMGCFYAPSFTYSSFTSILQYSARSGTDETTLAEMSSFGFFASPYRTVILFERLTSLAMSVFSLPFTMK